MSLLEVRNVSKSYGSGHASVTALSDVSFVLDEGRLLAVLGPSGSGKTTLLSIIAGLLRPTSGQIIIDGKPIHLRSNREAAAFRRSRVGLVFQDHHLVHYLTAKENLLLVPHLSGRIQHQHRELASSLLGEFGLEARANHTPSMLSGGERQRVAIARALMNEPRIMLVDEPTSNLDTERGRQVVEMLSRHISGREMTCVMVTHDPRMAEAADEALHLIDGRVHSADAEGVLASAP